MGDIIQDLLMENFRRVHERLGGIEQIMKEMRGEFISLRQQDSNLLQDNVLIEHRVYKLED